MSNKHKALLISIVAVTLLGGWLLVHFIMGNQTASITKSTISSEGTVDHEATAAVTDDIADNEMPEKTVSKVNTFPETLKRCFPELSEKVANPKAFIENWKSQNSKYREELDYIHYFFNDKEGKEVRAQILYLEANGRPVRELKIFRVLEDGLPDPVVLPEDDKFNPNNTTLTKYIDFNTVFETQKKWSAKIAENAHLEVEESNSEITEFQLYQDDLIFRCHEGDCECKTKN